MRGHSKNLHGMGLRSIEMFTRHCQPGTQIPRGAFRFHEFLFFLLFVLYGAGEGLVKGKKGDRVAYLK